MRFLTNKRHLLLFVNVCGSLVTEELYVAGSVRVEIISQARKIISTLRLVHWCAGVTPCSGLRILGISGQ